MSTLQKPQQDGQSNASELHPLILGIYLSLLSIALLLLLVFSDTSTEVQQVIVTVIGLLLLASLATFKQVIKDNNQSNLLEQYRLYFDNPINPITYYNTYNYSQGDTVDHQKQNLAEATEEIQKLLDKLSKTYDESPVDKSTLDGKILKKIEKIEAETSEKLTDKEKVIAVQVVEEVEQNPNLKQRLTQAITAAGRETARTFLKSLPMYGIVAVFLESWNLEAEQDR